MRISEVAVSDAITSVDLSRAAFQRDLHALLVHCQAGFDHFVNVLLKNPSVRSGRSFWGAWDGGDSLIGFAEFRSTGPGRVLLGHLVVSPDWQGRGVGISLLRAFGDTSPEVHQLELDVFELGGARSFYERLGLEVESESTWWLRSADTLHTTDEVPLVSTNVHMLHAALDHYGFGMLDLVLDGRTIGIGFPSRTAVRLPSRADLADGQLLGSLRAAFPDIETFLHIETKSGIAVPSQGRTMKAFRMTGAMPSSRPVQSKRTRLEASA